MHSFFQTLFLIGAAAFQALLLQTFWRWFAVPYLGLPAITYMGAVAVFVVLMAVPRNMPTARARREDKRTPDEKIVDDWQDVAFRYLYLAIAYLMAGGLHLALRIAAVI